MSKKLKLGVLSAQRTLRSRKPPVTANSSEKTSPFFADEEKSTKTKTGTRKRVPVKVEYNVSEDEINIKSINVKSSVETESENMEVSVDGKSVKTEECEIKDKNAKQAADSKKTKAEEQWMPSNWETILENIKEMRKYETAPVDEMGCHKCADPNASPSVSRYQSLIALMLSSQTKDQVTHAAMQRLNRYGCRPDIIAATPDDVLGKLIYPVGFWKVWINVFLFIRHYLEFNFS